MDNFKQEHPKLSKAIVIALVILIVIFIIVMSPLDTIILDMVNPKPKVEDKLKIAGYVFHQGKDSPNGNIGNQADLVDNVTGLSKYCDSMPNCVGFNTNGWVKSSLKPEAEWTRWTEDKSKGLFVKSKEHYSDFPGALGSPMTDPFY